MLKQRQMYAHKLIQTREIEPGTMKIGCVLKLITDFDTQSKPIKSEPYYYIGSTGNIGFFVHADIVNENNLLSFKKMLDRGNQNVIELHGRMGNA